MTVGNFMTRRVIAVRPDTSIVEAAKLMLELVACQSSMQSVSQCGRSSLSSVSCRRRRSCSLTMPTT